jgi:toxin HigB-1
MIKRFRHKELERFYTTGDTRGINAKYSATLKIILTSLNAACSPKQLNAPSFKLHPRKGDRKGQWAIWVSGNWRIVFEFDCEDVTNVDLVDYH